mmetsp:Transcript_35964/g.61701  ORF Transcript_35964/g.61701 Transcript_35964/m.61701 type:complete len:359 (+) Transcript_35964:158-1234(+)
MACADVRAAGSWWQRPCAPFANFGHPRLSSPLLCIREEDRVEVVARRDLAADDGARGAGARRHEVVHVVVAEISEHGVHGVLPRVLVDAHVVERDDALHVGAELERHLRAQALDKVRVVADASPEEHVVRLAARDAGPAEARARHGDLLRGELGERGEEVDVRHAQLVRAAAPLVEERLWKVVGPDADGQLGLLVVRVRREELVEETLVHGARARHLAVVVKVEGGVDRLDGQVHEEDAEAGVEAEGHRRGGGGVAGRGPRREEGDGGGAADVDRDAPLARAGRGAQHDRVVGARAGSAVAAGRDVGGAEVARGGDAGALGDDGEVANLPVRVARDRLPVRADELARGRVDVRLLEQL